MARRPLIKDRILKFGEFLAQLAASASDSSSCRLPRCSSRAGARQNRRASLSAHLGRGADPGQRSPSEVGLLERASTGGRGRWLAAFATFCDRQGRRGGGETPFAQQRLGAPG